MKRQILLHCLIAVVVWLPIHSSAENKQPSTLENDSSRVIDLDEVIVISQPKEAFQLRLQPLSSTMVSRDMLENLNIDDLRSLSQYVPSFIMSNYGSRLTSSMYIRGIGSRINNTAVGVYMDGMPVLNKSAFNTHLYQTERVDVLRGPQGTLYGQNTEGGLVRFYSRNPLRYQGTDVLLGVATYGYRTAEVAHYAKLGNLSGLSIAAFYNGQDGFFHNIATGEHADKINEAGGKIRFITQLAHNWELDYWADYQYTRQNGFPYGIYADGKTASPSTNRQGNYRRNIFNTALNLSTKSRWFDFHSTTSYQYLGDYMMMDLDYLPDDFMHLEQRQTFYGLTEEVVFKSNKPSSWHWTTGVFTSYQWLKTDAPVYFHESFNQLLASRIRTGLINQMIPAFMQARGLTYDEAKAFLEGMVQVNQITMSDVPGLFRTPQFNLGIFHESNFNITPNLVATIGLRYDLNHVSLRYATSAAMFADMTVMRQNVQSNISSTMESSTHNTFHQLLPKFGLRWTFDQAGSNLYATVSKGYRAGGFNLQLFSDIMQAELQNNSAAARSGVDVAIEHSDEDYVNINRGISYKPEVSWNYEFGTHLNLFNNQIQLDLSAFFMQIRNQQLSVMAENFGYGRVMVNAGKTQSCGLEASLRGQAFNSRLNWGATYSFNYAIFKDYEEQVQVNGEAVTVNYKDNYVPFVPSHSFSLNGDYTLPAPAFDIVLGANLSGNGRIYWNEQNDCHEGFYALMGAHADFVKHPTSSFLKNYTVSLWARNLTNRRFNTFAVESAASGTDYWFAQQCNPFQIGIDLRLHF